MPVLRRPAKRFSDSARAADECAFIALTEQIYREMIGVMDGLSQLRQEDYDLDVVKTQMVVPIARYLLGSLRTDGAGSDFVKPLFLSGAPGIGKTTLLMVLDEVLCRLDRAAMSSCRPLVVPSEITGYFATKPPLHVTPLSLFWTSTAVLSARDWNNMLRHWTFDEATARYSDTALLDFMQHLQGKIVMVDEAELEGYVYFSETLAQHGVLVILSSNLASDQVHLLPDHVHVITLHGPDHRQGDLARVCLPNVPHSLFDQFDEGDLVPELSKWIRILKREVGDQSLVYLNWETIKDQPLMKDDFEASFKASEAGAVLLDAVPFFAEIPAEAVDVTFLGYLSRFVNFVDAIHDCQLPLLVRGTHAQPLDSQTAGSHLRPALAAYDVRVGGHDGQAAWIEWTRCLSRLRSREAINALRWPMLSTGD